MNAPLRTDLNAFLFAPISRDKDGVSITVLSALARTGVDPWEEAAQIADLPLERAGRKLVTLLATLPSQTSSDEESTAIATRLVALLHRLPAPKAEPAGATPIAGSKPSRTIDPALYYLAGLILMLVAQWALST